MARNKRSDKRKLLKELEENHLVTRACKKLNIPRATYYRWLEDDPTFKIKVEKAQDKGRDKVVDFTEAKLIENVSKGNQQAITYLLSHNAKRYRPPTIRVYAEENNRQKADLEALQGLLDELIDRIGLDAAMRLAGFEPDVFRAKVRKELEDQRNRTDEL